MSDGAAASWIALPDPKSFSRILYPNPVVFLSTIVPVSGARDRGNENSNALGEKPLNAKRSRRAEPLSAQAATPTESLSSVEKHDSVESEVSLVPNVMVLTWLTACDNGGGFVFSINNRRHSSGGLTKPGDVFTLSVPVAGMEHLATRVGSTSGRWGNKFKQLESIGLSVLSADFSADEEYPPAIEGTVAVLRCVVLRRETSADDEHTLIIARVKMGWVKSSYWDGKCFAPKQDGGMSAAPSPFLTFLGSQRFANVHSQ